MEMWTAFTQSINQSIYLSIYPCMYSSSAPQLTHTHTHALQLGLHLVPACVLTRSSYLIFSFHSGGSCPSRSWGGGKSAAFAPHGRSVFCFVFELVTRDGWIYLALGWVGLLCCAWGKAKVRRACIHVHTNKVLSAGN